MNDISEETISQFTTALKVAQIMEKTKEGVPLNEVVMTTHGGKSKAVTQKEKTASDSLRRKQVLERLKKRTYRGDNSLAEDIRKRIQQCQGLMKFISGASSMSGKEILAIQRNLESTYNRAASLVKEVEVLESAIERKKQDDPVISEYEKKSSELFQAIKEQDFTKISELRDYCEQNRGVYNLRQKRLKPYLVKARQVRLKFVAEKRRLMRIQYETFSQAVELIAKELNNGNYAGFDQEVQNQIGQGIQTVREIRFGAKATIEKLNQPLKNIALSFINDIESELDAIDESYLNMMGEQVETLVQLIGQTSRMQEEQEKEAQPEEEDKAKRMAYQEKKNA